MAKVLQQNNNIYELILRQYIENSKDCISFQEVIRRIQQLAYFAWYNHPGYFADGRLENVLLEIGQQLQEDDLCDQQVVEKVKAVTSGRSKGALYCATHVGLVGGHSRVLIKMMKESDSNVLLLTEQKGPLCWIQEALGKDCLVITLNHLDALRRAATLRKVARLFKLTYLFTNPDEVAHVLAFAVKNVPPVVFENHAHFSFWLGSSVSDVVFSHSRYMLDLCTKRRYTQNDFFFPIYFGKYKEPVIEKREAKKNLGFSGDEHIFLAIGTEDKFVQRPEFNFFKTMHRLTKAVKNAVVLVVGLKGDEACVCQEAATNENIRFVGRVHDPIRCYCAADYVMETFPRPSRGALVEAVMGGNAFPIFSYGDGRGVMHADMPLYGGTVTRAISEEAYIDYIKAVVSSNNNRLDCINHIRMNVKKIDKDFTSFKGDLEELADACQHSIALMPSPSFQQSCDDVEMALASQMSSDQQDAFLESHFGPSVLIEK